MATALPEYTNITAKDSPDDATSWADWLEGFVGMINAMEIGEDALAIPANDGNAAVAAKTRRFDLLWHYIGKDSRKKLKTLEDNGIEEKNYAKAIMALDKCWKPTLNRLYQMHVLLEMKQQVGQSTDAFHLKVKEHMDSMNLNEMTVVNIIELLTLSQLANNTTNLAIKRKALKDGLSLQAFLDSARIYERTEQQLKVMSDSPAEAISYVKKKRMAQYNSSNDRGSIHKGKSTKQDKANKEKPYKCNYCGKEHTKGKCPAYGHVFGKCKKKNHFPSVCKSKKKEETIKQLENAYDSEESIYAVQPSSEKTQFYTEVKVAAPDGSQHKVKFQLDTGASCSTLSLKDYERLTTKPPPKSSTKLRLYDNSTMYPVGSISLKCEVHGIKKKIHFEVVKEAPTSLLSGRACQALELILFNEQCISQINIIRNEMTEKQVHSEYSDVFKGLGKLPGG